MQIDISLICVPKIICTLWLFFKKDENNQKFEHSYSLTNARLCHNSDKFVSIICQNYHIKCLKFQWMNYNINCVVINLLINQSWPFIFDIIYLFLYPMLDSNQPKVSKKWDLGVIYHNEDFIVNSYSYF